MIRFLIAACLAAHLAAAPIKLEAEAGALVGVGVSGTGSGYSGTGYITGFDAPADRVAWTFPATAGTYRLSLRYRTQGGSKGYEGALNGGGLSGHLPDSSAFADHSGDLVILQEGNNTLSIGGGWSYYEIDYATLSPEAPPPPPSPVPAICVDPQATPAAQALLTRIASTYGRLAYSGQQETNDFPFLLAESGRRPVILAGDLIDYSPSRVAFGGPPASYVESLISRANEGHMLSLSWHWNAPAGLPNTAAQPWWAGFYSYATTFDFAAALADPAGENHALMLRDIDAIAVQLRKFRDAGIPILWRPLHESEGGWFWWGNKGPEPFKQLWRLLYERLVDHHQIHNLVWVLTSEDPAWYPGDDVVDIVGADGYPSDQTDPLVARWEALRARFEGKKIIALTEFGGVPDIEKMNRLGVWWAWFTSWNGMVGPSLNPAGLVARTYRSPAVITLDPLPPPPRAAVITFDTDAGFATPGWVAGPTATHSTAHGGALLVTLPASPSGGAYHWAAQAAADPAFMTRLNTARTEGGALSFDLIADAGVLTRLSPAVHIQQQTGNWIWSDHTAPRIAASALQALPGGQQTTRIRLPVSTLNPALDQPYSLLGFGFGYTSPAALAVLIDNIVIEPAAAAPPAFLVAPALGAGPVVRRVLAASADPVTYAATGLPPGVKLDPATGLLTGAPVFNGAHTVVFTATNARGSVSASAVWLVADVPPPTLALARAGPALTLGWNIDPAVPVDVERSTTLAPDSWTVVSPANTTRAHTEPAPPPTVFYRLVIR